MEYWKIINLLDNEGTQSSKFRTKNWVEIDHDVCNTNCQMKFKTTVLNSSLCDYSDAFILVKEIITITGAGADEAATQVDEMNK